MTVKDSLDGSRGRAVAHHHTFVRRRRLSAELDQLCGGAPSTPDTRPVDWWAAAGLNLDVVQRRYAAPRPRRSSG